ncbi:MAG: tRNA pseudouridine(55) synthase TruB [Flavobacteriaceae bacterium TMED179]|nr:MAG: tRNA pseudouridine(55) synthase TruB [Flavobacteriaceae bacterium TMED179]|tara:strand:+ start:10647 stop:11351 length:705 start_codon:yes stop_codon:yes gene_type:complete
MDFFKEKFSSEILQEGQIFLIDKPLGWTSFQVINKIRWHLKNQTGLKKLKVGHTGTLDPLATGLLIICTGNKTKEINKLQHGEKTYIGTFTLGSTTPSYDLETRINATYPIEHITEPLALEAVNSLCGKIHQLPPMFSALKKNGKRLYKYAREGKKIEMQPREVIISKFEIKFTKLPEIDFFVKCSKGTYIRSLAYDFGKKLNSGAHLSSLRRIQNGSHSIEKAYSMKSVLDNK